MKTEAIEVSIFFKFIFSLNISERERVQLLGSVNQEKFYSIMALREKISTNLKDTE